MTEVTIIGIDLAKRVFQLHGARHDGSVVFRKKLSRAQLLTFVAQHPRSVVAMEACATAHGWGRELEKLGHEVRLIPPVYVKPFVKRQKNDVADADSDAVDQLSGLTALPTGCELPAGASQCRQMSGHEQPPRWPWAGG